MTFNIEHLTLNKKKFIFLLSFVICHLLFVATPVLAQGIDIGKTFGSPFSDLGSLISALLPNILTLAGVILLFLLIFGGFSYIINAGKGDSQGAGKGKDMITWAIVGFILIFAAYWIIQIIEYLTGINIFNPPNL